MKNTNKILHLVQISILVLIFSILKSSIAQDSETYYSIINNHRDNYNKYIFSSNKQSGNNSSTFIQTDFENINTISPLSSDINESLVQEFGVSESNDLLSINTSINIAQSFNQSQNQLQLFNQLLQINQNQSFGSYAYSSNTSGFNHFININNIMSSYSQQINNMSNFFNQNYMQTFANNFQFQIPINMFSYLDFYDPRRYDMWRPLIPNVNIHLPNIYGRDQLDFKLNLFQIQRRYTEFPYLIVRNYIGNTEYAFDFIDLGKYDVGLIEIVKDLSLKNMDHYFNSLHNFKVQYQQIHGYESWNRFSWGNP